MEDMMCELESVLRDLEVFSHALQCPLTYSNQYIMQVKERLIKELQGEVERKLDCITARDKDIMVHN